MNNVLDAKMVLKIFAYVTEASSVRTHETSNKNLHSN